MVTFASGFQVFVDTFLAAAFAATGGACMGVARKTGNKIGSFGLGTIIVFGTASMMLRGLFPGLVLGIALLVVFAATWCLGRGSIGAFRMIKPAR